MKISTIIFQICLLVAGRWQPVAHDTAKGAADLKARLVAERYPLHPVKVVKVIR